MGMLAPKVLSACWMCSVRASITVGVFRCCPGLTFDVVSYKPWSI